MNDDNICLSYYLTSNPFPSEPSFNKDSSNKRVNGEIFNEDIFKNELEKLHRLMDRRINLIYCQNTSEFVYGVGKSSIIAHAWRILQHSDQNVSSIFIRCQKKSTPYTLCAEVVSEWHRQGLLWKVLANCLQRYVKTTPSPEIAAGGAKKLSEKLWPIEIVDLRSYLVFNSQRLINALTKWASSNAKSIKEEIALTFFATYLKSPPSFLVEYPKVLRKMKIDAVELLRSLLELMELGGINYHYLFFDQFEDPIQGLTGKDLITFASGMRYLLEIGNGHMTVVVTLHPGAELTLAGQDAQEFITLAPLDSRHCVDVKLLTLEDAQTLAITYLDAFRVGIPPDPLYPFTPEAVAQIYEASQHQIRTILTGLNLAVSEGVEAGCPKIDLEFIQNKHEEITGQLHPDLIDL